MSDNLHLTERGNLMIAPDSGEPVFHNERIHCETTLAVLVIPAYNVIREKLGDDNYFTPVGAEDATFYTQNPQQWAADKAAWEYKWDNCINIYKPNHVIRTLYVSTPGVSLPGWAQSPPRGMPSAGVLTQPWDLPPHEDFITASVLNGVINAVESAESALGVYPDRVYIGGLGSHWVDTNYPFNSWASAQFSRFIDPQNAVVGGPRLDNSPYMFWCGMYTGLYWCGMYTGL